MKPMYRLKPLSSKTIVPYDRLTDPTSRLFRKITKEIGITMSSWKTYIDDYIRELYPDDPKHMEDVKLSRSTAIGNVNNTLWMSNKLSFSKLITGLRILKSVEAILMLKVITENEKEFIATDTIPFPLKEEPNSPYRLFKDIAKQLGVTENNARWKKLISEYIVKVFVDGSESQDTLNKERAVAIGNINDTLWSGSRLSFGKMLTGLAILKVRRIEVILQITTKVGKTYSVLDSTIVPSVKSK